MFRFRVKCLDFFIFLLQRNGTEQPKFWQFRFRRKILFRKIFILQRNGTENNFFLPSTEHNGTDFFRSVSGVIFSPEWFSFRSVSHTAWNYTRYFNFRHDSIYDTSIWDTIRYTIIIKYRIVSYNVTIFLDILAKIY